MYRINDDLRARGGLGSVSHPSVFVCCESGPLWPDSTAHIHEPPHAMIALQWQLCEGWKRAAVENIQDTERKRETMKEKEELSKCFVHKACECSGSVGNFQPFSWVSRGWGTNRKLASCGKHGVGSGGVIFLCAFTGWVWWVTGGLFRCPFSPQVRSRDQWRHSGSQRTCHDRTQELMTSPILSEMAAWKYSFLCMGGLYPALEKTL